MDKVARMNTEAGSRPGKAGKIRLLVLFVLAFYLRTGGLSHDLHRGYEYHSDTLKQMVAVKSYLEGRYYYVVHVPDIRGYPFFNSHLVEYLLRTFDFIRKPTLQHLGIEPQSLDPNKIQLVWITRWLNATLSALTVLIVFQLGWRFFNRRVAWAAALLLAFSPIDISIAHYATGDTTASFFATCAVFFAVAIYRTGSWRSYVAGGLCAAAAFSAKYNGGIALLSLVAAHILRQKSIRELFGRASIRQGLFLGFVTLIGVLLTTPSLLVYPDQAFKDIVGFMRYTADFGLPDSMRAMSFPERAAYSMTRNLPTIYNFIGPVMTLAALAGLVLAIRRRECLVLAVVPVVFFLVGLLDKPKSPPVYISMITPCLFLLGAFALSRLTEWTSPRRAGWALYLALLLLALGYLADYSRQELFFFRQTDTRVLAETWALDNVPRSAHLFAHNYTFNDSSWDQNPTNHHSLVLVVKSGEVNTPDPGMENLFSLYLENPSSWVFHPGRRGNTTDYCRNRDFTFYINSTNEWLRAPRLSPQQALPASRPDTVIPADIPYFLRSAKVMELSTGEHLSRVIASTQRLDRVLLTVTAGSLPIALEVELAGQRQFLKLDGGEIRLVDFTGIRPVRQVSRRVQFYPLEAQCRFGRVRLEVATSARERGMAQSRAGQYAAAWGTLSTLPASARTPEVEVEHAISGLLSGRIPLNKKFAPPVSEALNPKEFFAAFGIAPDYLAQIPFLSFPPGHLAHLGFQPVADIQSTDYQALILPAGTRTNLVLTPDVMLAPGWYVLDLATAGDAARAVLEVRNRIGLVYFTNSFVCAAAPVDRPTEAHVPFVVPRCATECSLKLVFECPGEFRIQSLALRPDIPASLNDRIDLLRYLSGTAAGKSAPNFSLLDYEPLLTWGDLLHQRRATQKALQAYMAAQRAWPERVEALERISPLTASMTAAAQSKIKLQVEFYNRVQSKIAVAPVAADFAGGFHLKGYRLAPADFKPGVPFPLELYWDVDRLRAGIERLGVWVHFRDEASHVTAAVGDRMLVDSLTRQRTDAFLPASFEYFPSGPELAPGRYQVVVGLWNIEQQRKIPVRSTHLPRFDKGVILTEITVAGRNSIRGSDAGSE